MKRAIPLAVVALLTLVAFASGVMAQPKPATAPATPTQESKLEKFSGMVEKVDEATKDILVQYHKEKLTFSLGDHTKIMEGRKELSLNDLKKGMWASIEYKKEGDKLVPEMIFDRPLKKVSKKENPSKKATEKK